VYRVAPTLSSRQKPRAVHLALDEAHQQQPRVEEGEEVAAAFDEVQVERDEAHPAGRVIEDDQAVAADHLLRSANRAPANHAAAKVMQRPKRDRLIPHLRNRPSRPEPDLQSADPERADVHPDEALSDPAVSKLRVCSERNENGRRDRRCDYDDRGTGAPHPRTKQK